jgi:hypothetical protein
VNNLKKYLIKILQRLILTITLAFVCFLANAQVPDSTYIKDRNTTFFPVAFYLPETSLGLGALSLTTFRFSEETSISRPSQVIVSTAYTFKNQFLLFVPFELYKDAEKTRIKGELGFYKYFYNYYGISNSSLASDLEFYNVTFPRFYGSYARTVYKKLNIGLGYKFDYFNITEIETAGLLDNNQPTGFDGGIKSNIFFLLYVDTRNNILSSTKGFYLETEFQRSINFFLSDFDYWKYNLDIRYYFPFAQKYTLASQLNFSHASNGTPFFDLPFIGSPSRARGLANRRYINYNIISLQSELRFPVYKRFSGVSFVTMNLLPDQLDDIFRETTRWSYGLGLRFLLDPKEGARMRLDVASGGEGINFYITLNEAF